MKENQQNITISKNIIEFNRECAQQRSHQVCTPPSKYQKRVHNYLIDTSFILGEGTFSTVYRGKDVRSSKHVAVKVIQINKIKQTGIENLFKEQINIIQSLNHPNIVACIEHFRTTNNCYTVYQYCQGGDLASLLQKGHFGDKDDLRQANIYIKDVFQGLLYLESMSVVHRDIKAANVFLHKGNAKIGDFGFATRCNSQFRDASIGSPAYMAPEGLIHNIYGPKTDVWAFGMLIYEMLHGSSPFYQCASQSELRVRIKIPINWDQLKTNLPSALKRLILKCLKVDSRQRPSFSELLNDEYIHKLYSEMSVKKINTKSTYSSKTSDTQNIFESTRIVKMVQTLKQNSQQEQQQIKQLQNASSTKNGQQLSQIRMERLQTEQCKEQTNIEFNTQRFLDDSGSREKDVKQQVKALQMQQMQICKIEEKDITILRYLMPCSHFSQLFSMVDIFVKTVSLHVQLQLEHVYLFTFYSFIEQLIKELNYLVLSNDCNQDLQRIRGFICQFYQPLQQFSQVFQQNVSCSNAVESVFSLIKQVEIMIDKQDINLNLQNHKKVDSKTLISFGNYLIQSYHLLQSLKANKRIQSVNNDILSQKSQSSQQFYIWLYELQLQRMDQV